MQLTLPTKPLSPSTPTPKKYRFADSTIKKTIDAVYDRLVKVVERRTKLHHESERKKQQQKDAING